MVLSFILPYVKLCEKRSPGNGNFWSDGIRVYHTNSTKGPAGVGIALNEM